jgi:hypothetical protein
MSIAVMKQALEALEMLARYENPETRIQVRKPKDGEPIVTMYPHKVASDAATALRAAIEQADPTLWYHSVSGRVRFDGAGLGRNWVPLYTAPRQWVGLTDEDIRSIDTSEFWDDHTPMDFARVIETKLKELNT